jgi:hypothetical protein
LGFCYKIKANSITVTIRYTNPAIVSFIPKSTEFLIATLITESAKGNTILAVITPTKSDDGFVIPEEGVTLLLPPNIRKIKQRTSHTWMLKTEENVFVLTIVIKR